MLRDLDRLLSGAGERVAYITIPKSTSVAEVAEVIAYIRKGCVRLGVERVIPIHVLIESQGALRDVWQIAELPGVEVLDFGLMDFISGHRGAIGSAAMRSPGQFEHRLVARAKTEIVAAALANGVVPAHNVTLDLKNPDQTREDARRARESFGFLRMWSIHPVQIDAILDAMRPDFSGLQTACAVLFEAQEADWGPIQCHGQLHDRASYRDLWQLDLDDPLKRDFRHAYDVIASVGVISTADMAAWAASWAAERRGCIVELSLAVASVIVAVVFRGRLLWTPRELLALLELGRLGLRRRLGETLGLGRSGDVGLSGASGLGLLRLLALGLDPGHAFHLVSDDIAQRLEGPKILVVVVQAVGHVERGRMEQLAQGQFA